MPTNLRVGLGEAEDVVNEEQHVLPLLVTEVLGNGKTSEGNARASTCSYAVRTFV